MSKIVQSYGFLGWFLGPLLKISLPLMKNVLKSLAKSALVPFGLTAAASATYAGIQKKVFGSGMTTLVISNDEMNDVLLINGLSEAIKNETKEQKGGFLGILFGALGARLLENLLPSTGVIRAGEGKIISGEGTIRAGQDFNCFPIL